MRLENDLGKDPIKKLVLGLAIPSMLAQFVNVLYSVVDRMYIGNIKQIGEAALAGIGVCGPIVTLLSSFSFLIGVGGAPLFSIRMGEGKTEKARQILANCFLMLFVVSILSTAFFLLMKNQLLMWFGASTSTFLYADEYMKIYVLGTVFSLMATGMNQFIICQGFAKLGMISVIIGAVINIVLDPILIFMLNMGVTGAAWATVFSQICSCVFVLWNLFKGRLPVKISFGNYSFGVMKRILTVGFTPFIIVAFDNILIITLNTVLQKYGGAAKGDMLITSATIVQSFMLLVTMPLGGITGGTQAILGFNYGAKQMERVKEGIKQVIKTAVIFTVVMFVLANTVSVYFVRLFTQNQEYISYCVWAIRIFTFGIIPLALQYSIVDGFTGMGIVMLSLPLSFLRKGLFFLFVLYLPAAYGVDAVFYAEPVIDIASGCISTIIYLLCINQILNRKKLESNKKTGKAWV